jgi:hypothetical protein
MTRFESTSLALCERPEVTGYPTAGANHLVAEAFADAE